MIECRVIDRGVISYEDAFALQKSEVARVQQGGTEVLYLLEHPHVITVGRNGDGGAIVADERIIRERGVTISNTDRGGDVTYHGPGQLVGYPVIHLEPGRRDIRRYVHDLEEVLMRSLSDFAVAGRRHPEHRGVWVGDSKIASLGVRVSRWVTCHGFALNINTDLSYFSLMHPCGIAGCKMTSLADELGSEVAMDAVKRSVLHHFANVFGRTVTREPLGPRAPENARAHVS